MLKSKEMILSIAVTAVFTALIWIMNFVPQVGFIITGGLSITTLHIPMIIGVIALPKTKWNLLFGGFLGGMFGMAAWVTALQAGGTADSAIFMNPLMSILPRVIMGVAVAALWMLAQKLEKLKFGNAGLMVVAVAIVTGLSYFFFENVFNSLAGLIFAMVILFALGAALILFYNKIKDYNSAPVISTLAFGTFTNTVLVLTAFRVFDDLLILPTYGLVGNIIRISFAINGSVEMIAAVIIGTPIVLALNKLKKSQNLQ